MALPTNTFSQIVSIAATAMQAATETVLDFAIGSVLLAIGEAIAGVCLWLQALVLQLALLTRAATSEDADLDSFYADFDFPRELAVAATGLVTFGRATPTQQAVVPINAGIQVPDTGNGAQKFFVTADATNSAYSAAQNGYVLPPGVASVTVPVQAVAPGGGGNVLANTITQITGSMPGVDAVTNADAFANGVDAEADQAYRDRFALYINSLSRGTKLAILAAVKGVRQGLTCTITANQNRDGTANPGFYYVVVDDGTGTPSDDLIAAVSAAIDGVNGFTISYAVFKPNVLTANLGLTITSASGFDHAAVVGAVGVALTNFCNALPLGTGLPYTQIAAIAYGIPGVANVAAVLLGGGTADLAATQNDKVLAGTVTVA